MDTIGRLVRSRQHNPSAFTESIRSMRTGQIGDKVLFDLPEGGLIGTIINLKGKKGIRFTQRLNDDFNASQEFTFTEFRDKLKVKLNLTRKGPVVNEDSINAQANQAANAVPDANVSQKQSIRQKVIDWYNQSPLVQKTKNWSQARGRAEAVKVAPSQDVIPEQPGLQRQNASRNLTYDPKLEKSVYQRFLANRPRWLDRQMNQAAKKPQGTQPTTETVRKTEEIVTVKANEAASAGRISSRTKNLLITTGLGAAALSSLGYGIYALASRLGAATEQHQADTNGCYLVDLNPGLPPTLTKIQVLTCGNADITNAMETCAPHKECSSTQFNPCLKDAKAPTASQPVVPGNCDRYVYKGTKPAQQSGVQMIDACLTEDGKALSEKQNCSSYCKTSNFILEEDQELMCVDLDYDTAFIDLLQALGYTPPEIDEIVPPKDPPPAAGSTSFSKPLLIATVVLASLFLLLGVIWWRKRN